MNNLQSTNDNTAPAGVASGADYEGLWLTRNGARVRVLGWEAVGGYWKGYYAGAPLDADGIAWDERGDAIEGGPGLDLVEAVRQGGAYK